MPNWKFRSPVCHNFLVFYLPFLDLSSYLFSPGLHGLLFVTKAFHQLFCHSGFILSLPMASLYRPFMVFLLPPWLLIFNLLFVFCLSCSIFPSMWMLKGLYFLVPTMYPAASFFWLVSFGLCFPCHVLVFCLHSLQF